MLPINAEHVFKKWKFALKILLNRKNKMLLQNLWK